MSNFEDYDLRKNGANNRRPQRPTNRPNSASSQSRMNYDFSLDGEVDMYEYGSENMRSQSQRRAGSQSSRSASGRKAAPHSASHPGARRASSASGKSRSGSSNRRPSSSKKSSGKRGGKKKKTRRAIIVVEIVIIIVLLLLLFVWNKFSKINFDTSIDMEEVEVNNLDEATEELLSNYTTLALFGVDNRSNGNLDSGNSDTIILVSINNDTKEVKMVSVQRDTYLKVADDTYRKCNYAYNHGGVEQAIAMLNTNLDIKISGYVSVDFYALATVVDDLGGLELEITQKMIDTDNPETNQNALAGYIAEVENVLNYYPDEEDGWKYSDCYFDSPGTYTLNGAQVVGYCRNRYAVNNDYGRAENQREVIKKIIEKVKKADVGTLNDITNDVFPSISTSLSLSQILSMATSAGDYEISESSGFPFALKSTTISKKTGSVLVPCTLTSNVVQLHKFLYDQDDYDPTDDSVDVISDYIQNQTGFGESSADITQESD